MANENEKDQSTEESGVTEKVEEAVEKAKEVAGEAAEKVEELAEDVTEEAKEAASGIAATVISLKEKNPKLFYGGIAAIVLLLFGLFFLGGGGGTKAPVPTIQIGKTYTLVNPNVTGGGDVLLFSAPGRLGATDPKIREQEQVCIVDSGTKAKVTEQTVVNYIQYVKVEPLEGDCAGKSGWTSIVNLKAE